ncbi:ferritin [Nocardia sp. BMG51109]|uniref:ferritin n=1 Tax=Nocardia sp. BMG51109 TaxID=1056816 RepID=UPI0004636D87|nr:ferritin-like domain-containing protein [Nocardia sp. BMG51109]
MPNDGRTAGDSDIPGSGNPSGNPGSGNPNDERPFSDLLQDHVRHEFTAAQQYLAAAVHLDALRLPRLAGVCYRGSGHRHAHALRMIRHLLDRNLPIRVGGLEEIVPDFESPRAAIDFMLRRERLLADRLSMLSRNAWETGDYVGEQFVRWFLRDQADEVARMTTLLAVFDRADGDLFAVEDFVASEEKPAPEPGPDAPKMAGTIRN